MIMLAMVVLKQHVDGDAHARLKIGVEPIELKSYPSAGTDDSLARRGARRFLFSWPPSKLVMAIFMCGLFNRRRHRACGPA